MTGGDGKSNTRLMKGNEALAEAALRAGMQAYFGYPITPQTEIMEYLAIQQPNYPGVVILQAESELAAINMVHGASGAGARAMISSSSPGAGWSCDAIVARATRAMAGRRTMPAQRPPASLATAIKSLLRARRPALPSAGMALSRDPLVPSDLFAPRHLGSDEAGVAAMLAPLGASSLDALMEAAVPAGDDAELLAVAWHRKALAAGELDEAGYALWLKSNSRKS